jgi:histidinol phosphatase-like PHP family hydrolase
MLQDLHTHTYYSFCGKDSPETLIKAAIAGGIEVFGFTDHAHGVGFGHIGAYKAPTEIVPIQYKNAALQKYLDHLTLLRDKYADRIKILRGIEVSTESLREKTILPDDVDLSCFDYCLIEHLDSPTSVTGGDLFSYAKRCGSPLVGVAHTDLFGFIKSRGKDPYAYFCEMAKQNIFWEMNVSYDSIHKYEEHGYMLRFFEDPEQQAIVRESGVLVSIGFDGHRVEDYLPKRVKDYCNKLSEMKIKMPFEED